MNFYKHYIGDYQRDTGHLNMTEDGAYRRLLDTYYAIAKPLPADPAALYRIAKAFTASERRAVDAIAEQYFPVSQDGLRHNKRADQEIADRSTQVEANRRVVAERERQRHQRQGSNGEGTERRMNEGTDHRMIGSMTSEPLHSHSQNQNQDQTLLDPAGSVGVSGPPPCPQQAVIALYHELLPSCPRVVEWTPARETALRARWREKSRPNGVGPGYTSAEAGLRWWREFFTFVAQSDFLAGRTAPAQGRSRPFVANLEWLLKPGNFAKVIEGNYHDREEATP